jgi:hypothetical protein
MPERSYTYTCTCCNAGTGACTTRNGTRFRVFNDLTGRYFFCSTDQSAKGRPEWIFYGLSDDIELMTSCSLVITEHDSANTSPRDLETFPFTPYPWDEENTYDLIVRVIDPSEGAFLEDLRRYFFHQDLPHGVVAVFPLPPAFAAFPKSKWKFALDFKIVKEIEEEKESYNAFMQAVRSGETERLEQASKWATSAHRCHVCGKPDAPDRSKLLQCGRCKSRMTLYCSKPCQRQDWSEHKKECVPPTQEPPQVTFRFSAP